MVSDGPMSPDAIAVSVAATARPLGEPNGIATAVFWAYFQACEQGLLSEGVPPPWERLSPMGEAPVSEDTQHERWLGFLGNLLTDTSWTAWLADGTEATARALGAHAHLGQG